MTGSDLKRAYRFQETFFKAGTDPHDFTGCLHLRSECVGSACKFIKRKTGELCDNIVKTRLKGSSGIRHRDFFKRHSNSDFSGYTGNWISACLRCKRRRTGNSRIDLNEIIFACMGMQGKLNIASTLDLKLSDDLDCTVVQHFQIMTVQRHDGSYDDGISGVNADRIDIFHTANGNSVII